MIELHKIVETDSKSPVHWEIGTNLTILKRIHYKDVNIAIYERDVSALTNEINNLLEQNIEFKSSGDIDAMVGEMMKVIHPNKFSLIISDIKELLSHFKDLTDVNKFRLLLTTVNSNMCRRFHKDINDIRMLCTYSGPGTLWLTNDNVYQKALNNRGDNRNIVIEENSIQQVKTGAVALLKGAIYPHEATKAVVHRSPTIEESGEKRLLLRIDTL